ncbi:MAG TPA: hypothetical protein VE010_15555, partial [Thermoanaerobaculia bacterium]|nr:hypothetical protein [Thermoanaerobaculia bacterium]
MMRKGDLLYAVEVKRVSEGRSDRLVPVVAQAVLQARRHASAVPGARPLVIVVGKTIPPRVADAVKEFTRTYADDVALGLMDDDGLRAFEGAGLQTVNSPRSHRRRAHAEAKAVDLFSDLNQWLLKVLLAADLAAPHLLNAPVGRYRNATELARAANVSVMTAFRYVDQLRSQRHLHESSPFIRLVRLDELLDRWRAAARVPPVSVRAKWLFAGDKRAQMRRVSEMFKRDVCVRSYAGADALGFGIVRGVPTDFYLRQVPDDLGRTLGLVPAAGSEATVFLATPSAKESVFRGAIEAEGVRSTDVLQVWLEVGHDPTRGPQQAEHLHRKVI